MDCFWDNPARRETYHYSDSLTFHPIDAENYLAKMTECAGLISTAGFESVAEAMYLGKPAMMVPVPNHIEQMINAYDGEIIRSGNRGFDFFRFNHFQELPSLSRFRARTVPGMGFAISKRLMAGHLTDLIAQPSLCYELRPKPRNGIVWHVRQTDDSAGHVKYSLSKGSL